MASSTLAALTGVTALDGTELVYMVKGGADFKGTIAQLFALYGREILKADRTIYVNKTGGSDSNPGTSGSPFLTIMAAMNSAAKLDFNGFTVTIQMADTGVVTYTERVQVPAMVGQKNPPNLILAGNASAPTNITVQNLGGYQPVIEANVGAKIQVRNFRVSAPNNGYGLNAAEAGVIEVNGGSMDFGDCTGGYHMYANNGGTINVFAGYTISGPASVHYCAAINGTMYSSGITVNANSASIGFGFAFAAAFSGGSMQINGITFSNAGNITGQRYNANTFGTIVTFGSGANYLPGSVAGSNNSGKGDYS